MSHDHRTERPTPPSGHRPRGGTAVDVDGVEFIVTPSEVLDFVAALTSGSFTVAVDERDIDLKDVER